MRDVALGQWIYFAWHLPAVFLCAAATLCATLTARSLWRESFGVPERRLRYAILGWSAVVAALLSAVAWPYLAAFSSVAVAGDGTWTLRNYLGVPVAVVPADEVRRFQGEDLGGLDLGSGRIRVIRADGSAVESVRVSGHRFRSACRALGYPAGALHPSRGSVVTGLHTYGPQGPVPGAEIASR